MECKLAGVVYGWRAGADTVSLLGEELRKLNHSPQMFRAVLDSGKVTLVPDPKKQARHPS